MTDPIADMLTRIRNGAQAKHDKVDIPSSGVKVRIAELLKEEGYINSFKIIKDHKQGILRVYLKWISADKTAITGIKRISKPGRRIYTRATDIPRVLRGLGIAILSTSKGIVTDEKARKENNGGEILCHVW